MDLEKEVKTILSLQLDVPVEEIELSTRIVDDLGADSLCIVEITLSVEELLNIDLSDEEVYGLGAEATVKDIIAALEKRLHRRNDEPTIRTGGAVSGRFSSDGPNYSNIPREKKN